MRASDGLALSSRNRYLSPEERSRAPAIYQALRQAALTLYAGSDDFAAVEGAGLAALERAGMKPDYFAVRNADLTLPQGDSKDVVVLAAVRLGPARLIDNLRVRRP